jgi:hypothetical protein
VISLTQSVQSTNYIQALVTTKYPTTYNPTADTVQFAFTPATYPMTSPTSWATGTWVTFPGPAYWAQTLVGPMNGGTALSLGAYQVWLRITDNPEVPVLQSCMLTITP